MNSPRALILSIAATAASFVLALVGVIASASSAATPVAEVAMVPGSVAIVAQEVRYDAPVVLTVELGPVASPFQAHVR